MTHAPGPCFSVVVPAYNAAGFIAETLDSVRAQTFSSYELVVVDDGSTDGTAQVVAEWAVGHSHVTLQLVHQEHLGIGAARNAGVRLARGPFIAFLDADDAWERAKLETVAGYLDSDGGADLVCHDEWLVESGVTVGKLTHGPYKSYYDLLFKGNSVSTSATVVRRDRVLEVGGFSAEMRFDGVEDYDLWLRLARAGCRFEYLHETLGRYRVHEQGVTNRIEEHAAHMLNLLEAHFAEWRPKAPYLRYRMRKRRSDVFRAAARAYLRRGERRRALRSIVRALREDPVSWKGWAVGVMSIAGVPI